MIEKCPKCEGRLNDKRKCEFCEDELDKKTQMIQRIAIAFAFVSTFGFFVKILFF